MNSGIVFVESRLVYIVIVEEINHKNESVRILITTENTHSKSTAFSIRRTIIGMPDRCEVVESSIYRPPVAAVVST